MNCSDVFRSLRDIFPQVDLRVLRAVAFEHPKDLDSAVDFILDEVIPSITGSSENSLAHHLAQETEGSSSVGHHSLVEVNTTAYLGTNLVDYENGSCYQRNTTVVELPSTVEVAFISTEVGIVGDPKEGESSSSSGMNEELNLSLHSILGFKDNGADSASYLDGSHLNACNETKLAYANLISGNQELLSGDDLAKLSPKESENGIAQALAEQLKEKDAKEMLSIIHLGVRGSPSFSHHDRSDLESVDKNNIGDEDVYFWDQFLGEGIAGVGNLSRISGCAKAAFSSAKDLPSADLRQLLGCDAAEVRENSDTYKSPTGNEKEGCRNVAEDDDIFSSFKSEMPSDHDPNQLQGATSHLGSSTSTSIDFLEEFIADAKSKKNKLLSSFELVNKMINELELLKAKAKEAEYESSIAGQDVLNKVEELKQMLKHAKEANDMHVGEVFGKKSILATEAQELHARLSRLSDERDKYLAIIDEICQALEERLAVAEREIAAAEKEKLEKETLAQDALHEQERMMNAIVEESWKLQQEAEENLKLREFLVEGGRVVDTLQGELAVVFEDVLLLKDIVDEHLPLSRLHRSTISGLSSSTLLIRKNEEIHRSTVSVLSSSSNTTTHKSESSPDRIIQTTQLTEKHLINLNGMPEKQELSGKEVTERASGDGLNRVEDGWELCEDEAWTSVNP